MAVSGITKVKDTITRHTADMRRRAESRTTPSIIIQACKSDIRRAFVKGVDSKGERWPGLLLPDGTRTYDVARARHPRRGRRGTGRSVLWWTGKLFQSIGSILRTELFAGIWKMMIGTNLSYAGIHNRGGDVNHPGTSNGFGKGIPIPPHRIHIVQREYLYVRDETMQRAVKAATHYIVTGELRTA